MLCRKNRLKLFWRLKESLEISVLSESGSQPITGNNQKHFRFLANTRFIVSGISDYQREQLTIFSQIDKSGLIEVIRAPHNRG